MSDNERRTGHRHREDDRTEIVIKIPAAEIIITSGPPTAIISEIVEHEGTVKATVTL